MLREAFILKQELKALLDPELSIITTFLEIFDDKMLEDSHLWFIA